MSRATTCILLTLFASVAGLVGGCASSQQQRAGKHYLAAGEYDLAVQAARQAVEQDPRNPRNLDLLSDAETAAADYYYEQARKLADQRRPGEAAEALNTALEYMPAHPQAITLRVSVNRALQEAARLCGQAREALARKQWEQAASYAQQAYEVDEANVEARQLLAQAGGSLPPGPAEDGADRVETVASPASPVVEQVKIADASPPRDFSPEPNGQQQATPATEVSQSKTDNIAQEPAVDRPQDSRAVVVTVSEPTPPTPVVVTVTNTSAEDHPVVSIDESPPRDPVVVTVNKPDARGPEPRLIEIHPSPNRRNAGDASPARPPAPREDLISFEPSRSATTRPEAGALSEPVFWVSPRPPSRRARLSSLPPVTASGNSSSDSAHRRTTSAYGRMAEAGSTSERQEGANSAGQGTLLEERHDSDREPRQLFRGALSRDDDRFKKQVTIFDGITIKLRDTDGDPLDADFQITAGKFKIKPDDVPPGGKLNIRGASGRAYILTVIWIDDDQETVHFSIDRAD